MVPSKSNDFSIEGNLVEDPCHVVTGSDRNLVFFRLAENNRRINRLRSVVKRTIAQVTTWRVFSSGVRRPLGSYSRVFSSGAGADLLCS